MRMMSIRCFYHHEDKLSQLTFFLCCIEQGSKFWQTVVQASSKEERLDKICCNDDYYSYIWKFTHFFTILALKFNCKTKSDVISQKPYICNSLGLTQATCYDLVQHPVTFRGFKPPGHQEPILQMNTSCVFHSSRFHGTLFRTQIFAAEFSRKNCQLATFPEPYRIYTDKFSCGN